MLTLTSQTEYLHHKINDMYRKTLYKICQHNKQLYKGYSDLKQRDLVHHIIDVHNKIELPNDQVWGLNFHNNEKYYEIAPISKENVEGWEEIDHISGLPYDDCSDDVEGDDDFILTNISSEKIEELEKKYDHLLKHQKQGDDQWEQEEKKIFGWHKNIKQMIIKRKERSDGKGWFFEYKCPRCGNTDLPDGKRSIRCNACGQGLTDERLKSSLNKNNEENKALSNNDPNTDESILDSDRPNGYTTDRDQSEEKLSERRNITIPNDLLDVWDPQKIRSFLDRDQKATKIDPGKKVKWIWLTSSQNKKWDTDLVRAYLTSLKTDSTYEQESVPKEDYDLMKKVALDFIKLFIKNDIKADFDKESGELIRKLLEEVGSNA